MPQAKQSSVQKEKTANVSLRSASLRSLVREIERRHRKADKIRSKIQRQIAQFDGMIEVQIKNLFPSGKSLFGSTRPVAQNKRNLSELCRIILSKGPMPVAEIAASAKKRGYISSSPNFTTIVNQCLVKDPQSFTRHERGVYGLNKRLTKGQNGRTSKI